VRKEEAIAKNGLLGILEGFNRQEGELMEDMIGLGL